MREESKLCVCQGCGLAAGEMRRELSHTHWGCTSQWSARVGPQGIGSGVPDGVAIILEGWTRTGEPEEGRRGRQRCGLVEVQADLGIYRRRTAGRSGYGASFFSCWIRCDGSPMRRSDGWTAHGGEEGDRWRRLHPVNKPRSGSKKKRNSSRGYPADDSCGQKCAFTSLESGTRRK